MDLDENVAIVTGAGSGLGWFVAASLRRADAHVVAADVRPGDGITEADVTTVEGRTTVLDAAQAAGDLGVLVNNAGGWSLDGAKFPDATPTAWRNSVERNLLAPMDLTQRALPSLRRVAGAVVNVASSAGASQPQGRSEPRRQEGSRGFSSMTHTAPPGWVRVPISR